MFTPRGGAAFDSFILTLDESDAVRVAIEDAKNDPDEGPKFERANYGLDASGMVQIPINS